MARAYLAGATFAASTVFAAFPTNIQTFEDEKYRWLMLVPGE